VTEYIPTGNPLGTIANKVVSLKKFVDSGPKVSNETTAPVSKSVPVIVIVFDWVFEIVLGFTLDIPNAASAGCGVKYIHAEITNRIDMIILIVLFFIVHFFL